MKQVLIIAGSLRKQSFNLRLAHEIAALLSPRAEVAILDYSAVPFLNQDLEFPPPQAVADARAAAASADGIWIVTPEYNYNVPGVLKNLLDWLSRPLTPDRAVPPVMWGKPVTIAAVAGKSGGAGVRRQLKDLLEIMRMRVVGDQGLGVPLSPEDFASGTLTLSPAQQSALARQAKQFLAALDG